MSDEAGPPKERRGTYSRQPKQLVLAFFGEHILDQAVSPLRASALIEVLDGAGVAAPATRAALDRLVRRGLLAQERRGREILFSLTVDGASMLREATARDREPDPFAPRGEGWTLVTFTVPEQKRALRHRLRSSLMWEGFAPLRDGLWIAPGEVDLAPTLAYLRADLPAGALTAFHAHELSGFALTDSVRSAWDLERIREDHLAFIDTWSDCAADAEAGKALAARAMLVADWHVLLRADPRLPREYLGTDWPADRSFEIYWTWRKQLDAACTAEFEAIAAPSPKTSRSAPTGRDSAPTPNATRSEQDGGCPPDRWGTQHRAGPLS